jgi:hypothetical protein
MIRIRQRLPIAEVLRGIHRDNLFDHNRPESDARIGGKRACAGREKSGVDRIGVSWYFSTTVQRGAEMTAEAQNREPVVVERVQTGVRMEKRMLKVLKAVAEQKDMTLGDLLEGIVLHAFEGKVPFSERTLKEIEQFKALYGMKLMAADSHNLKEKKK